MTTQKPSTKPTKLTTEKLIFRGATDLTPQEFRALAVILTYSDEHCRNAYPGHARLREAGVAKDRKRLSDILKSLEAKGYLKKTGEAKTGKGGNMAQRYDVLVPAWIMAKELGTTENNPLLVDNANDNSDVSTGGDGVVSTPRDGVVSTPRDGVVSTPLSGPVSGPASGPENPSTVTADAPTHVEDSKDEVVHLSPSRKLHHHARQEIFEAMMRVTDPHSEQADDVVDLLEEHYNEGVAGYAANYWTFRRCLDEYDAAKQLNMLVHTVANQHGPEYLEPDNTQALAQAA